MSEFSMNGANLAAPAPVVESGAALTSPEIKSPEGEKKKISVASAGSGSVAALRLARPAMKDAMKKILPSVLTSGYTGLPNGGSFPTSLLALSAAIKTLASDVSNHFHALDEMDVRLAALSDSGSFKTNLEKWGFFHKKSYLNLGAVAVNLIMMKNVAVVDAPVGAPGLSTLNAWLTTPKSTVALPSIGTKHVAAAGTHVVTARDVLFMDFVTATGDGITMIPVGAAGHVVGDTVTVVAGHELMIIQVADVNRKFVLAPTAIGFVKEALALWMMAANGYAGLAATLGSEFISSFAGYGNGVDLVTNLLNPAP